MPATIAVDARKLADFGIGTYIRNLIEEFASRDADHRYVLLVAPDHDLDPDPLDERFRLCVERAPVYSLRGLFSVSRQLRRERVDLFHATHYVLPLRMPCPAVVTIHDLIHLIFPEHLPNRGALLYARLMLGHATRTAQRVITVSQHSANDLQQRYGLDAPRLQVIANGVDGVFLEPPSPSVLEADRGILRRHGLDPGYLLFVGNPKPHKNLHRTLEAFAAARNRGLGRGMALVGCDPETLAGLDAPQDGVHALGFVDSSDLPALYRQASQLAFPSLYEGFGLPVLEAMAAGTPVLTSRESAMAEVAGDCAVLVEPTSVEAICKGMLLLDGESEAERTQRSARARKRAARYSWSHTAERTLSVYDDALTCAGDGR